MASSEPAHGNLTPPRISPSCPHCMILRSSRAVAGQEYHCILCRSWPHREPPGFYRPPFLAHTGRMTARPIKESRWDLLIRAVPHGAASESAFAHRTGKGEVTDEWICGCQGAGKVSSEELPSPIVMKLIGCQPCSANITLNFSTAIFNDFATA